MRPARAQLGRHGRGRDHHRHDGHHPDPQVRRDGRRHPIGHHLPDDHGHADLDGPPGRPPDRARRKLGPADGARPKQRRRQTYDAQASTGTRAALRSDTVLRRVVDFVITGIALLLVSPLLLAVAAAVMASSRGPVIYKQARMGKSGDTFTMLKFRTMVPGADRMGPLVTNQADPRVTRLGSWLGAA